MTGDAGHHAEVADLLASEFTVVTYNRRGNSRGPRPQGWTATSIDEQDAAAGDRSSAASRFAGEPRGAR
jgi:hypothetical protein